MDRHRIFARDEHRCVYCAGQFDAEALTVDHVEPRVRGGDHSDGNLVTACMACNTAKGHARLSRFLLDNPAYRANFFEHAVHVWPRLMRRLREELAQPTEP